MNALRNIQTPPKIASPKPTPIEILKTEVQFNVKCENTKEGDIVAIVGSCPELGNWSTFNDSDMNIL
jgi:hypothetical protein